MFISLEQNVTTLSSLVYYYNRACVSNILKLLRFGIYVATCWLRHYATNWKVAGSSPG
jgi:hypothetical protein